MKTLSLILIVVFSAFVSGCGGASTPAANNSTANSQKPTTDKPASNTSGKPTTTSETTAAVTGVPACDEYLANVEKFIASPNVPQATRDAYKQTLEQNRTAWKQAASTPQGKAGLETSCKMALDALKTTLDQFPK